MRAGIQLDVYFTLFERFVGTSAANKATEIRAVAQVHGILEHHDHWRRTLSEAADIQCGRQLRDLFAVVLVFGMPDEPENVKTKLSTTFVVARHQLFQFIRQVRQLLKDVQQSTIAAAR